MYKKWYLNTWFICLIFAFSYFIIPFIVGVVLVIMQHKENKALVVKYGKADVLNDSAQDKESLIQKLDADISSRNARITELRNEAQNLVEEISSLEMDTICSQYLLSDYDGLTSEECKNKLALIKSDEQKDIKDNKLLEIQSKTLSKKILNEKCKQITREFNTECDNALLNLTCKKIDTIRGKITKAFETLNKSYAQDYVQLSKKFLEYKLDELNLVYTYELKKEQEHEQQRAIKEQMIEEEKVRKEIERQKAQIEKDQTQCNNEINRLMAYMQKTQNDVEKQLYIDKIKDLEEKLKALEADKATVLEREANARAGYVYVISNIGSFGENVYKIGMTRRLEPMDRIKELSSASVPFEFDVHAMIFSDDAPTLEATLHQKFEKQSVNRVNLRKEFFKVSLDEIEDVVKNDFNNTTEFTRIPVAKEYYETLDILKHEEIA